jgi:Domain of unknown function (DUF4224)
MFLTETDVRNLTGYRRPSAQVEWLRRSGWRFAINALGKPVVALAEFNRRMVGSVQRTFAQQEPNWDAMTPSLGGKA